MMSAAMLENDSLHRGPHSETAETYLPHLQSYDKEAESSVYFEAGQVVKTVNPE